MRQLGESTAKGVLGVAGGCSSWLIASIETLTPSVKFAGALAGLMVAVASLVSIIYDILRKHREWSGKPRQ